MAHHSLMPTPSWPDTLPHAGNTRLVDARQGPWPLHDAAATRALEQAAQAQAPTPPLMARAGLALARLGRALAPHARRTLVLAGPGNNGGDGLVAARLLHSARHAVHVRLVADPAQLPADAAHALRTAASAGVDIQRFDALETFDLGPQDLAIDALLGLGSRRAPEGAVAQAIALWPHLQAVGLAVDLPSGLHPDTGALLGTQAVQARATLALLTLKPGCFTAQGRDHAGQMWWNDLGLTVTGATAWLARPPGRRLRPHAGHKGRFGDVWLLGGASGMEGALVLAAHAALAAGAGRVFACPLQAGSTPRTRPEIMLRPLAEALQPSRLSDVVTVAGCGGGQAIEQSLASIMADAGRLVLDADALNAVAASQALQKALQARSDRCQPTVLTPHPLEAARLLGCSSAQVQADRLAAAAQLARRWQALVVLKGSGSVVASAKGALFVNPTGNAALGTAGTGDVLAGWIGGLWAQCAANSRDDAAAGVGVCAASLADEPGDQALGPVLTAVWTHGAAADAWSARGNAGPLLAGDLIEAMLRV